MISLKELVKQDKVRFPNIKGAYDPKKDVEWFGDSIFFENDIKFSLRGEFPKWFFVPNRPLRRVRVLSESGVWYSVGGDDGAIHTNPFILILLGGCIYRIYTHPQPYKNKPREGGNLNDITFYFRDTLSKKKD